MAQRKRENVKPRPALRVLQRGDAMVPEYRAAKAGIIRRLGMSFRSDVGPVLVNEVTGEEDLHGRRHGGFEKLASHVHEIAANDPYYNLYVKHLRDGDLWAADQATADAAGVAFDPDFEGEHEEHAKGEHSTKVRAERDEATKAATAAAKKLEGERAKAAKVDSEPAVAPAGSK